MNTGEVSRRIQLSPRSKDSEAHPSVSITIMSKDEKNGGGQGIHSQAAENPGRATSFGSCFDFVVITTDESPLREMKDLSLIKGGRFGKN